MNRNFSGVRVNEIGLPIWSTGTFGDIVILSQESFGQWNLTIKSAMLTAKCFGAANGKVKNGEDGWEKIATDALHILSNSVGFDFKNTVVECQEKNDPKGLWDFLQAINPLSDPTVVSELRREFLTMKFEPSTESV
ncbi:hypothetical protein K3495_g14838 [Podosphaera aphanis]|nr:hypothetical protein K3495_g14838 [Podosphaera aphanis]